VRLLVTGASGFLGRNLVLASDPASTVFALYRRAGDFPGWLRANGLAHVVPVRCDLSSPAEAAALGQTVGTRLDGIVHLAANGDPAVSVRDPRADLQDGPGSLIGLLTAVTCDRLVYFSSGAVYDGLSGLVGPETELRPTLPYAISKQATEQYVRHFRESGRVGSYVIARFFGAYGPYEPDRKIYTRLVRWAADTPDQPFEIRGNGENLIDAMYVSDAVRAIALMLSGGGGDEIVDLGSGAPMTINDLVVRAGRILGGIEAQIRHVGSVPEYIRFSTSPAKMARLFGFTPGVALEEGLVRLRSHLAPAGARR
jgi:nucleoside-diphosphate-sugar epimerase